jgi:hypothetical protein
MYREGDQPQEYFIVLHGNFQCVGQIFNGHNSAVEWNSEVRPGQDFFYEMGLFNTVFSVSRTILTPLIFGSVSGMKGIGGEFGCISTAIPLLSKPSETTIISEETRKLMSMFDEDTKLPHVKVCSLLSLNISDLISVMQPDELNLQHISKCLRQAILPTLPRPTRTPDPKEPTSHSTPSVRCATPVTPVAPQRPQDLQGLQPPRFSGLPQPTHRTTLPNVSHTAVTLHPSVQVVTFLLEWYSI